VIDAECCRCRRELETKGGVLLMPPSRSVQRGTLEADLVDKLHLCTECAADVVKFLETPPPSPSHSGGPFASAGAACSFCAKKVGEPVSGVRPDPVRYIIQGPRVTICDDCVSLCEDILSERGILPPRSPCTLDNCGHVRQLDAIVDLLGMHRGGISVLDELRKRAEAEWVDSADEWTAAISAAHPARSSESHDEYGVAMRMVGHRHSKGGLVALVNWLLVLNKRGEKLEVT